MCVLLITRLLRGVGRWARKPVNHTSWVAVVTPTDRPKSVRNCCLIELFCGVVCVVNLPFWHFCWCRGFCHRTGSDLLLFVLINNMDHKRVVVEWWERWTCNLEAGVVGSNPTVDNVLVMFTCSVFPAAGLATFKWNQAWHSSEVIDA